MKTPKVICVGLNKTATKSLAQCLQLLGYNNHSYCLDSFHLYQTGDWASLFSRMDDFDSFEDWPWPLMYREIESRYPDAKFILTTRSTPDVWYRSLCKMAVRMGPLNDFEKHIYGFSMPQGHREEHLSFYNNHNTQVREHFSNKPGKLLELCFDDVANMSSLCNFLNHPLVEWQPPHANKSQPVYAGDSLWRAHIHRIIFQLHWHAIRRLKSIKHTIAPRLEKLIRR